MQVQFFGGLDVRADDTAVVVHGRGQEALLFRLAMDAGTVVGYRALAEDVWPADPPEDPRASLQSLASRLRRALPSGTLEAAAGGYRLNVSRDDVDATRFQDLTARARRTDDPISAAQLAQEALLLWTGDPWAPDGADWALRDLLEDRAHAERIAAGATVRESSPGPERTSAPTVPALLTPLVGRSHELALIAEQLAAERLVTVIGPGGAGKTTLALETARERTAVIVELAPAAPGEVWAAVAGAVSNSIRVRDATPAPPISARDRAMEALTGRQLLLVLDNCEHLSDEAAAVALEVLRSAADVRILATSREPLGLQTEAFVDLGPLPDADAVELFSRRVRAARGHAPDDSDAEAVEQIVRRLDGLPLALELAAAKTRTLGLAEVATGLDDRFALLASGPKAIEPRHRTLRALIDWSWETLTDQERSGLRLAAVLPDGLDAVDAPTFARFIQIDPAVFDALVDRSLLRRRYGRFRMLETVREYGLERLRADDETDRYRASAARAIAELAIAYDALVRGPRVREAASWFDSNEENLTSALRACRQDEGLVGIGLRIVRGALWAWIVRERFEQLRANLQQLAGAAPDSEAAVVVETLRLLLTTFEAVAGDDASASPKELPEPVKERFTRRKAELEIAARAYTSDLAALVGPLLRTVEQMLVSRAPGSTWSAPVTIDDSELEEGPEWSRALLCVARAALAQNSGDVAALGDESDRALRMFRDIGDVWGIALASQMRSEWLMLNGRLDEALEVADASTEGLADLTSVTDVIQQRALGITVLVRMGRLDEAAVRVADINELARTKGSHRAIVQAEVTAAALDVSMGDGLSALRRLDLFDDLGHAPEFPDQVMAWVATLRAQSLLLCDRPGDARESLRLALTSAMRSGDHPIIAAAVMALAAMLAWLDEDDEARSALSIAVQVRGCVDETDPLYVRLRDRLGHDADVAGAAVAAAPADLADLLALLDG